ncbi:4Fe-4S binding domain-containing protein [Sporobacter termitidis DSM 10068]|uniref:4Fe-4S binding domain-containing protein n=1 Tax=Sporobacter termitidis DSM 10068 TaxID=1123282 RepID=A0A1M5Z1U9_9FIRM|nr:4Fe-4S dicluster domain-containing protein [Sporobacter termitidis]SHI18048.1 4Fe-4S binding domain-containing protein [Sporobacter termitidis DSM 10068]
MRQKVRRVIVFTTLFLFPVIFNYLSPYVSLDAAFAGLVAGSVMVFAFLFLSGIFLGRAWCAWFCPVAGLSELGATINDRPVKVNRLAVIRYAIFGVWFAALAAGFILAGGIRGFDPLYLTEHIVSVDEPLKFINYYLVLAILFALTVTVGKRGACHTICWMAPFLTAGELVGRALRLPQLKIRANPSNCVGCGKCTTKCPMSIDVAAEIKTGSVASLACIRCGECIDGCPKRALCYGMGRGKVAVGK